MFVEGQLLDVGGQAGVGCVPGEFEHGRREIDTGDMRRRPARAQQPYAIARTTAGVEDVCQRARFERLQFFEQAVADATLDHGGGVVGAARRGRTDSRTRCLRAGDSMAILANQRGETSGSFEEGRARRRVSPPAVRRTASPRAIVRQPAASADRARRGSAASASDGRDSLTQIDVAQPAMPASSVAVSASGADGSSRVERAADRSAWVSPWLSSATNRCSVPAAS